MFNVNEIISTARLVRVQSSLGQWLCGTPPHHRQIKENAICHYHSVETLRYDEPHISSKSASQLMDFLHQVEFNDLSKDFKKTNFQIQFAFIHLYASLDSAS